MSWIISKTVLFFITASLFLALIFYSFFSWEKDEIKAPTFNIESIWETDSGSLIVDKVDFFTTIYSRVKDYSVSENNIKFWTWFYIIDSRHSFNDFTLDLWDNKIILESGWMLYIDNNPKYKKIISFNNKAKIEFFTDGIDEKTKLKIRKKTVELYLYPHMYFWFSPKRFKYVKSADSLRISQLWILNYFNWDFNKIINNDSLKFIDNLEKKEFLKESLINIISKQKEYLKEFINKKNTKISTISWIDFIEKYFVIFYNERKKSIYYKNKILENSIKLLNENKKNSTLVGNILGDLDSLKNVNEKEYNEMKKILRKFFFLILYDLDEDGEIIELNYSKIIVKLFDLKDNRKLNLLKNVDRYNFLWNVDNYFNLLNLSINNDLDNLSLEYYILFKQNMLISNMSNKDLSNELYDILLNWFISYSDNIENYFDEKDEKKIIQNIIYNKTLLDIFYESLSFRYFENEKNSQWLLILKWVNINNIDEIKSAISKIFKKYKKSISFLDSNKTKYSSLIEKYDNLEVLINEYISALSNYSLYEENYSKVNRALIDVKIYQDDEEILSKKSFEEYIQKFNWINKDSIELEVVDNLYYKINNIFINNLVFSFELYPYSWYLIKNIKVKNRTIDKTTREFAFYNNLESTSFSLGNEEEKYKVLFEKAKDEEKETYDFKNFFINKFFLKSIKKKENYKDKYDYDNKNEDDDIIQTFKIAKLLGDNWEFDKVKKYLKITYNNLDVKRISGNNYSIKIVDSDLNLDLSEWNKKLRYSAKINSSYRLSLDSHYFYNIIINPYLLEQNSKKSIFPNIKFKIIWKINLITFNEDIEEIFKQMPKIESDYNNLKNKSQITEISYSMRFKKVTFK